MRYSIGEFASITGVTADTLRLYEKHNILRPLKDDHNKYRYFHDLDARNLLMSRWYRSMMIPLHDVSSLINGGTMQQALGKLEESKHNLQEQLRKSTLLLNKINEIHTEIEQIRNRLRECQIKSVPGRYRLKQTDQNRLLKEHALKQLVNEWMDLLPFTFFCFRIENWLEVLNQKELQYSWGVSLTEDDMRALEVEENDYMEYLPPATCLTSVIYVSEKEPFGVSCFQFMLDEIKAAGHLMNGDITGKILLNEYTEERGSYLEVNIPIQPAVA
ncbi:MerR family transcriptional regulator [Paenibacillus sp. 1001270B_150601_E10]|uniref:MerR family transcriptional regulator n=1 Tax=Paenibacillus sp. 1001270B_150601_E10 TaxID=2787079 RepID=UPI00189DDF1A|nr:MerR family transcriptional regulator [Paenibacillus sp. 1001270B_150601_E10]